MNDKDKTHGFRFKIERESNFLEGQISGRKRSRCCRSKPLYSSGMIFLVMASINVLMSPASGFQASLSNGRAHPQKLLWAVRSTTMDTLQPVKPRSSSSREKREEAMRAMNRDKVESALGGVDAQMLEMLSDQFLYPSRKPQNPSTRPRGRPDFVPGAMKYETMIKFQERKEMNGAATQQNRRVQYNGILDTEESEQPTLTAGAQNVRKKGNRKVSRVKGSGTTKTNEVLSESSSTAESKKRKRIVKNLPERNGPSKNSVSNRRKVSKGRSKTNNLELQKYYRTELLTAEEEYSLGVKIQLMVKCEQVHEGLALQHMRLPSVEEWATACG